MVELNATLIAQIINFLILVAILTKVAYKPLMQALADRQARIAESIAAADRERAAAEELRREYQQQLAEARTQAQAIVEKAMKLAEQTKEQILEEARAEHARLLKEAQAEIARERERALAQMKNEVVSLSIAAATKIIGQNLDEKANAKLVEDFIDKLDRQKIGGMPC
ncbi:ATP synthase F0, B subunit [Thermosinus carboxydivorans Nor1]|uniref:ATP synthase subunit b n=1 Tax=Thermosinus carboxydivorans Nor1 TaxID=401526 RepID=A1HRD0_9FIRM|nr:F0F1 ATP synthase subunit B [Thermosinus carboxydivorans]EAX47445.1 ATP synthase F0, B subunit [Thermosinus carboxydivorans Nor1]